MSVDAAPAGKMGDLKTRTLSAIVMIAVGGGALWVGGWLFTVFVGLIAAGLLWEWWGLISKFNSGVLARVLWMLGGIVYVGTSCGAIYVFRSAVPKHSMSGLDPVVILLVIVIDVCAYISGRFFGGPKIAPRISPSKTWAGLIGAMVGAVIFSAFYAYPRVSAYKNMIAPVMTYAAIFAILFTVIAQAGDFFESWLKRRADVKDSGQMLPGHGGLLDRLDGLLALMFVFGAIYMLVIWLHPIPVYDYRTHSFR